MKIPMMNGIKGERREDEVCKTSTGIHTFSLKSGGVNTTIRRAI